MGYAKNRQIADFNIGAVLQKLFKEMKATILDYNECFYCTLPEWRCKDLLWIKFVQFMKEWDV